MLGLLCMYMYVEEGRWNKDEKGVCVCVCVCSLKVLSLC